jgi:hypothetical protein
MINPAKYNSPQSPQTKQEETRFFNVLQIMPGGRSYAADHESFRGGISLIRSVFALAAEMPPPAPSQSQLIELFKRISDFESSLVQSWKLSKSPPPPPPPWKNPVTHEILQNPFAKPIDRAGQSVLLQADPVLAKFYKRLAANPYEFVSEIRAEEAKRAALNAITYTAQDHDSNPYRDNSVAASQAQGAFRALHGDLVAEVWKQESSPVRLPWSGESLHRSACGAIIQSLNESPVIGIGGGDCVLLAMEFSKGMIEAERLAAEQARKAAEARLAELSPA